MCIIDWLFYQIWKIIAEEYPNFLIACTIVFGSGAFAVGMLAGPIELAIIGGALYAISGFASVVRSRGKYRSSYDVLMTDLNPLYQLALIVGVFVIVIAIIFALVNSVCFTITGKYIPDVIDGIFIEMVLKARRAYIRIREMSISLQRYVK